MYDVYTGLKLVEEDVNQWSWEVDPVTAKDREGCVYIYTPTPEGKPLLGELKAQAVYSYQQKFEFLLPYGEFEEWDAALADLVGFNLEDDAANQPGGPFYELLGFNYGCLDVGAKAAAKIVADFEAYEDRAREFREPSFYLSYWWAKTAFIHATTHHGMVCRAVRLNG